MKVLELIKLPKKNNCFFVEHGKEHDKWHSNVTGKDIRIPRHGSKEIPKASKLSDVALESSEEFVNYIVCDTIEYAKRHNGKAVKKTLTIPAWLNEATMKAEINFSQVLQEALLEKVR